MVLACRMLGGVEERLYGEVRGDSFRSGSLQTCSWLNSDLKQAKKIGVNEKTRR